MTLEQASSVLQALHDNGGNQSATARALDVGRRTFIGQMNRAKALLPDWTPDKPMRIEPLEELPDGEIPIEEVIAYRTKAFERAHAKHKAEKWRTFKVPVAGPYALWFVGDPHLDDDGCHLPLWERHVEALTQPDVQGRVFAVNIGDTTNNWVGRMARLWAEQEMGAAGAKRLVKHYLGERGIPWFLWLSGNHDLWDGPVGKEVFEAHKPHYVVLHDWQAKVQLQSPDGHTLRLWAAHNFKGNSIWNNLHGLERAAQMQDWAHLYVAGHHHDCGYRQGENPHRGFVYNLLRVRGYKWMDDYADHHGFGEHQYGASAVAVIDPAGDKMNAVTCFMDPEEGLDFLRFKRRGLD